MGGGPATPALVRDGRERFGAAGRGPLLVHRGRHRHRHRVRPTRPRTPRSPSAGPSPASSCSCSTTTTGRSRRARSAQVCLRSAGRHVGLLARARGDGRGLHRRRRRPHRRPRLGRRPGPAAARRPGQGDVRARRLQRLPDRGRGGAGRPTRRSPTVAVVPRARRRVGRGRRRRRRRPRTRPRRRRSTTCERTPPSRLAPSSSPTTSSSSTRCRSRRWRRSTAACPSRARLRNVNLEFTEEQEELRSSVRACAGTPVLESARSASWSRRAAAARTPVTAGSTAGCGARPRSSTGLRSPSPRRHAGSASGASSSPCSPRSTGRCLRAGRARSRRSRSCCPPSTRAPTSAPPECGRRLGSCRGR